MVIARLESPVFGREIRPLEEVNGVSELESSSLGSASPLLEWVTAAAECPEARAASPTKLIPIESAPSTSNDSTPPKSNARQLGDSLFRTQKEGRPSKGCWAEAAMTACGT